jgi:hypothetical protein
MSSTISPGMHPVISALRVIDAGLDELAEGNLWSLLDGEALEVRLELERLGSRLHAARLRATREVATRGAVVRAGAPSTRTWLINKVHLHPGAAGRELTLAAQLDTDLPATAASDAQLREVATAAERADAEVLLVEFAETIPLPGLQNAAIHLGNRLDPDQGDRLAEEDQAQVARREFRLTPNPDGSSRPGGHLDTEATALLRRPGPAGQTETGRRRDPRPAQPGPTPRRRPGRARRAGPALRGPAHPGRPTRPARGHHRPVRPGKPPRPGHQRGPPRDRAGPPPRPGHRR